MITRREWIERDGDLPVSRQCVLAGVARSWIYATKEGTKLGEQDLELLEVIDAQYGSAVLR